MASPQPQSQSQYRTLYLTYYNSLFATLWAIILLKSLSHTQYGKQALFAATAPFTRWVQTTAFLEVIHSALGLVKSPLSTTALQVSVRIIHVWMVWFCFPSTTASSSAYLALLVAWSAADVVRYVYLALHLWGLAPGELVWLRYTMFYPLYPLGIGAEWWLLYCAIPPGGRISPLIPPFFVFLLVLYVPGAYVMYTHMIKQRRKVLGNKRSTE